MNLTIHLSDTFYMIFYIQLIHNTVRYVLVTLAKGCSSCGTFHSPISCYGKVPGKLSDSVLPLPCLTQGNRVPQGLHLHIIILIASATNKQGTCDTVQPPSVDSSWRLCIWWSTSSSPLHSVYQSFFSFTYDLLPKHLKRWASNPASSFDWYNWDAVPFLSSTLKITAPSKHLSRGRLPVFPFWDCFFLHSHRIKNKSSHFVFKGH